MGFFEDVVAKHKENIVAKIFDDKLQEKVVKALNDNINIPIISEATEEKILNAIYDSIEDVVRNAVLEKL